MTADLYCHPASLAGRWDLISRGNPIVATEMNARQRRARGRTQCKPTP
jgi:hypothetical protein